MVALVADFCSRKISDADGVRLYFKNEEYKRVKSIEKMFKYQATSLFNLIQSSGFKADFYRKKKPNNGPGEDKEG
jgi:hypothetical protein